MVQKYLSELVNISHYFTNLKFVRRFGDESPPSNGWMNQGEEVEQASVVKKSPGHWMVKPPQPQRCQAAPSWLEVKPDAVSLAA